MIQFPNAKINLGLYITEKRPDGFHNLVSCFYPVGWTDALEIVEASETIFSSSGIPIPGNNNENLCIKAWKSMNSLYNIPPVKIHLHKVIPIGAGLGGGSSDAAFTVKALNQMFALNLTHEEMQSIVRPLGSDCAFFINNEPVIAINKGDEFQKIDLKLKGYWCLLIYPGLHISTKEAYSGVVPTRLNKSIEEILRLPVDQWKTTLSNDFEKHLFSSYPVLNRVKSDLYNFGAIYASMTGSGSCIFGIFEKEPDTSLYEHQSGFSVKKIEFT